MLRFNSGSIPKSTQKSMGGPDWNLESLYQLKGTRLHAIHQYRKFYRANARRTADRSNAAAKKHGLDCTKMCECSEIRDNVSDASENVSGDDMTDQEDDDIEI